MSVSPRLRVASNLQVREDPFGQAGNIDIEVSYVAKSAKNVRAAIAPASKSELIGEVKLLSASDRCVVSAMHFHGSTPIHRSSTFSCFEKAAQVMRFTLQMPTSNLECLYNA